MFAIVPAFNEAPSVARVVAALLASGELDDNWPHSGVIVVDDGSSDGTAEVAEAAGAQVIQTPRNLGKGGAMLFAYSGIPSTAESGDDRVAFFDADLLGLTPAHVRKMAAASDRGFDQVAALRDKSGFANMIQIYAPLITGQRIVRRWVLDALPDSCWKGYSIETAINDAVDRGRGRTAIVLLEGLRARTKLDKAGRLAGIRGQVRMAKQIVRTRRALHRSEGMTCEI